MSGCGSGQPLPVLRLANVGVSSMSYPQANKILGIAGAILPIIGIASVYLHKIGEFAFYEVPIELIELKPIATLVHALGLAMFIGAALFTLLSFSEKPRPESEVGRFSIYVVVFFLIVFMYWNEYIELEYDIHWPSVLLVLLASASAYVLDRYARRTMRGLYKTDSLDQRASSLIAHGLALVILIVLVSVTHGYLMAKSLKIRTFLQGSDMVFVGPYEGRLLFKKYDARRNRFEASETTLLERSDQLVLVQKVTRSFGSRGN